MYLTKWEERAINGEYGEAIRLSMELLVRVGEALGADRLVPIKSAHVSGISVLNIGEEGVELIERLVAGVRVAVRATVNPMGFDTLGVLERSEREWMLQLRLLRSLAAAGFTITLTCTPYEGWNRPRVGDRIAWAESSAVAYANSVLGARSNREGGVIAVAAAVTGRIYNWGLLLDEARSPTYRVVVDAAPLDTLEAGALGYILAEASRDYRNAYGVAVPLVEGRLRSEYQIRSMLASAAAWGDLARVVIKGVTPDWRGEAENVETLRVDHAELKRVIEDVSCCDPCDVDAYYIGCPHAPHALLSVLERIEVRFRRPLLVSIPAPMATRDLASRLSRRNILVLGGTCLIVYDLKRLGVKSIATDSFKAAFYLSRRHGVKVALATLEEMVRCVARGG